MNEYCHMGDKKHRKEERIMLGIYYDYGDKNKIAKTKLKYYCNLFYPLCVWDIFVILYI